MSGVGAGWLARGALLMVLATLGSPAGAAEAAMDLKGSEWGFKDEMGEHQRFIQFGGEGLVSGSGGCNRFGGGYEQAGDQLTIAGLITTRMGCAPEIMQSEHELLAALEAAHHVEASHGALKIFGADGKLLLDLVRRDWD
jgi:heat shock protein HslJ